jgi:Family of unknown function (DUF6064)
VTLPFTSEQFFGVFADYNRAVWPMPVVLVLLAAATLVLVWRRPRFSDLLVAGFLSFLWLWMALAYHIAFFARINPAAFLFAALFVIEAVLLARAGRQGELSFRPVRDGRSLLAAVFVGYALVGYPLLCALMGQHYPATPTFGLPCPTTIFTFGVLLTARPCPLRLLVIPAAWALLGSSAAWQLGVGADYALLVAGIVGTAVAARRPRRWERAPRQDSRA